MKQFRTYKGAIHLHTNFSDGGCSMEEVIEAAQDAGLDYIIITDHDKLTRRQTRYQRRYGNLLVICGYELTFRKFTKNHILVFGVPSHTPYRGLPNFEKMKRITEDGGKLFIAHPWSLFKPWLGQHHLGWSRFPSVHYDGLEIWSYLHDWVRGLKPTKLLRQYHNPDDHLTGPGTDLLARWDRLNMKRPVAGIGGLDNHARKVPFSSKVIFSNKRIFRTILTHIVADELSGDTGRDIGALIDALAEGRSFFANNLVADAGGVEFFARDGEDTAVMGRRIKYSPGLTIRADSPVEADLALIHNGTKILESKSCSIETRPPGRGVCRLEAHINGRPWLFTNHIRIV